MSEQPPDTIYLIRSDDGYSYYWCEDAAPAPEMDADDAIPYTREPLQQWISVEYEPKPDRNILLLSEDGRISTGYLCLAAGVYKPDDQGISASEITHWQPLPSPPKESI